MLTAIDLCCGAGGWIEAARGLPIRFLGAADWAEDCCATVVYNHPDMKDQVLCADVTTRWVQNRVLQLGKIDIFLGAIPCEEVSKARDNRPASVEDMARWHALIDGMLALVQQVQPRWWAIENVVQMKKHLPPMTPFQVLDSGAWSMQSRRRIFVGQFPRPVPGGVVRADWQNEGPHRISPATQRLPRATTHWMSAHARLVDTTCHTPTIMSFSSRHERAFVIRQADGRERVLTLAEAARLQGFPRDFVFVANESRAWKMVGQAVQIDTARAILTGICREAGALGEAA